MKQIEDWHELRIRSIELMQMTQDWTNHVNLLYCYYLRKAVGNPHSWNNTWSKQEHYFTPCCEGRVQSIDETLSKFLNIKVYLNIFDSSHKILSIVPTTQSELIRIDISSVSDLVIFSGSGCRYSLKTKSGSGSRILWRIEVGLYTSLQDGFYKIYHLCFFFLLNYDLSHLSIF